MLTHTFPLAQMEGTVHTEVKHLDILVILSLQRDWLETILLYAGIDNAGI